MVSQRLVSRTMKLEERFEFGFFVSVMFGVQYPIKYFGNRICDWGYMKRVFSRRKRIKDLTNCQTSMTYLEDTS